MKYCITIEKVRRISVTFCADNDEDAEEIAAQINRNTTNAEFEPGDEEQDYALFNCDTQRQIIDWD